MKRPSDSARPTMTLRPPAISASRPGGAGSSRMSARRLPAMDLIGARLFLISWPSTWMILLHAWRSSSRSARARSERTSRLSAAPSWRMVVRLSSQRPCPPGNLTSMVRGASPDRASARLSLEAGRPRTIAAGSPRSRSPARFSSRSSSSASKAKTATSISSRTLLRRAVASTAPSLCSRSMVFRSFASRNAAARGPLALPCTRVRNEGSSTHIADRTVDRARIGLTSLVQRNAVSDAQAANRTTVVSQRIPGSKAPVHSRYMARANAGNPARPASRVICRSNSMGHRRRRSRPRAAAAADSGGFRGRVPAEA